MKTWTFISGSKARRAKGSWLWLLLALNTATLAETAPDLELLEFLGDWQDDSGLWLDPLKLNELINEEDSSSEQQEQDND